MIKLVCEKHHGVKMIATSLTDEKVLGKIFNLLSESLLAQAAIGATQVKEAGATFSDLILYELE